MTVPTSKFAVEELGLATWPDFVRVMEKHNGVWNGCWCVAFHPRPAGSTGTAETNRAYKEKLVRANQSHAALVYDEAGEPFRDEDTHGTRGKSRCDLKSGARGLIFIPRRVLAREPCR